MTYIILHHQWLLGTRHLGTRHLTTYGVAPALPQKSSRDPSPCVARWDQLHKGSETPRRLPVEAFYEFIWIYHIGPLHHFFTLMHCHHNSAGSKTFHTNFAKVVPWDIRYDCGQRHAVPLGNTFKRQRKDLGGPTNSEWMNFPLPCSPWPIKPESLGRCILRAEWRELLILKMKAIFSLRVGSMAVWSSFFG